MIDFGYLHKGLAALARAHRVNSMSGHLGAAVIAGYFIGEQQPELDESVFSAIEGELDMIIAGKSVFSPGATAELTAPQMFEIPGRESPRKNGISDIAESLAMNIGQLHESGHNVIFASIALRALHDHPDLATPTILDGICQLIRRFDTTSPGSGYFGKERGRINGTKVQVQPRPEDAYSSLELMAERVVDELIQHAAERREGFGGLWHLINHAAGLVELSRYGYRELAVQGLPAHQRHLQLLRALPDVTSEMGPETPTQYPPAEPAFWAASRLRRERAHLTHRIKTIYGFEAILDLIEDEPRKRLAREKLQYLM